MCGENYEVKEQNSRWKNGQFRKENEKHTSVTGMIVKTTNGLQML